MLQSPAVPAAMPLAAAVPLRRSASREGAWSGLAGGLLMLALLSASAAAAGLGWLQPLEAVGTTIAGGVLPAGPAALIAGLALHGLIAALLGVPFASVLPDDFPATSSVTVGVGYGLFVAGIMMSVVVPAAATGFRDQAQPMGGTWVCAHGLFGAALAYVLSQLRRGSRRPQDASPAHP